MKLFIRDIYSVHFPIAGQTARTLSDVLPPRLFLHVVRVSAKGLALMAAMVKLRTVSL
jgi:hypothetical protein